MQNPVVLFKLPHLPSSRLSYHSPFFSLIIRHKKLGKARRPREREWSGSGNSRSRSCSGGGVWAMPCSAIGGAGVGGGGGDGNGALTNFKLNESTFLASLMPKKEIGVDRFIDAHPNYDGRGALIAIFDSGVDPAASGLQVTSDGKPKVLDVLDCTGSGDVDTSKVVKADDNGCIRGNSGASLFVDSSWKNPSGEWHVGYKLVYELFTDTLTSRLKKERRKKWDEQNQEEIAKAVKHLQEFDQKHSRVDDANLKRAREDLQNRVDYLQNQADSYDDKGPVIDAVVWHDGEVWRVALDTQTLEDNPDCGKLANFVPLTNYRIERKYGVFSKLDACTFVANVYDEGNILSIVTDSSPHGTHVAGIATAFHPKEPLLNGVAPGAQIISCKIGDSRLGSMETGTGLTRALIAAVEHKCDLINMSYGEPTLLPDYGRFVDLVNEAVNKHHLIFVSSAGNSGPALSTVGAPGGTTSSIIGVGAYVSPAMAAGAHCVVEAPGEGLEYTWSSRGPTSDGALGVCISAPGAAVAPVPTWTLQQRMLMNGTSMSSPSACGGIALLVSALKAEGIPVSPYSVRKALENTSVPISSLPEDKLSTGQGLMQVDKAHEYLRQCRDVPCVWYQIQINQSGKTTPTARGIYLREASAFQQSTEWTVQVEPKFHEGANNLEDLVPFEECIELHSSDKAVLRAPDFLLLTHNGRSFNIVVDPTKLSEGLHYFELYGVDCKAPWRGTLFRIPVTITKPIAVISRPPLLSFSRMSFLPGHIERRFIQVPLGATWVEATMQTSGFDTSRRFFVDSVQLCPLQRPLKWESVVTFSSPAAKSFSFPVVGGQTMELAIAQFWSSGIGSHETTIVDFEIVFHGININKDEVVLDGSEGPTRIEAEALLASETLAPVAILNKIRIPYRPVESKLCSLSTDRDKLPSEKRIMALTLTYKIKLEDGAEVKPQVPLLNNRVYDTKFESQFYMISDANKRIYAMGDTYPSKSKLPKGEYNLRLYLRHDNVQYLEKLKQLVLFIERNLEEKDVIRLSFFSQPDGPLMGNGSFKSSVLVPGKKEAFYLGPPSKDKLLKSRKTPSSLENLSTRGLPMKCTCEGRPFFPWDIPFEDNFRGGGPIMGDLWALKGLIEEENETPGWTQLKLPGQAPSARCGHTITSGGHYLLLFGGHGTGGWLSRYDIYHNDCIILDRVSAQWKRLPTGNEPPPARAYHSLTCMGSRYLLFGGFDGKSTFGDLWWLVPEEDSLAKRLLAASPNIQTKDVETGNESVSIMENQMEESAVSELQKRLGISVSLLGNGVPVVDEVEDKEFIQLASNLVGERVSSNEHVSDVQALRDHWRKSTPRLIPLKELGPLLRDYQRLITRRLRENSGYDMQFLESSFPGKVAYGFYHIRNVDQLRLDDIPKLLVEYKQLLPN